MAHRRDQKEALRREREERERRARDADRRKRLVVYGGGGLAALAAAVVLVIVLAGGGGDGGGAGESSDTFPNGGSFPEQRVFDVGPAARAAGCELRVVRGEPAIHTNSLDVKVDYSTNPPSTGRHYQIPAEDGIYEEAPPDEALVHSLEHGRVIFWAKPGLPEDQRANLRALADGDPYQLYLVPRRNMPYAVAATAWNGEPEPNGRGQLLTCERMNDRVFDALAAFRDEHRSRGPEPVP